MRHKLRDIDSALGNTLRRFRKKMGLSQATLANAIGISFQQLQKYENGVNRISASRMLDIARVLALDIADFYRDSTSDDIIGSDSIQSLSASDLTAEELELIRLYNAMSNNAVKQAVIQIMKANT